jgi:hypothetical protein
MTSNTQQRGEHIVLEGDAVDMHAAAIESVELATAMVADTLAGVLTVADPADCSDMDDIGNGCYRRIARYSE